MKIPTIPMTLLMLSLAGLAFATSPPVPEPDPVFYQGPAALQGEAFVTGKVVGINRPGTPVCVLLRVNARPAPEGDVGTGGGGHLVLCNTQTLPTLGSAWRGWVRPIGTQRVPVAGGKTFQRVEPVPGR